MAANPVFNAIVLEVLTKDNYLNWSVCVQHYLLGQDLWDIVETESKPRENAAKFNSWRKKNALALHAIQISCGPDILSQIREISSAKAAWDYLAEMQEPQSQGINEVVSSASDPGISVIESHEPQSQGVSKPINSVGDSGISNIQEPQSSGVIESTSSLENPGMETNDCAEYFPLVEALKIGNWDAAKDFLDYHQNAVREKLTSDGFTALHFAVTGGHVEIVEVLVPSMSKQDLAIQDNDGSTALHVAAADGHVKILEVLLPLMSEQDLAIQDNGGWTALHFAVTGGHVEIVEALVSLMSKQDLAIQNYEGSTALHFAAIDGHVKILEVLRQSMLEQDLAIEDNGGSIALHFAAADGHMEILELLLQAMTEQDLAIQDNDGSTALHSAVIGGHVKIVEVLVLSVSKQDLAIQDNNGSTALHAATVLGHVKIVEALVSLMSKQDLAIQQKDGCTALHFAVSCRFVKIVEVLVQSMSEQDLAIQQKDGQTALMLTAARGFKQMAACMVEKNKNLVRVKDKNGIIPVTKASVNGQTDMVHYLYPLTPLEELTREKGTSGAMLLSYCIIGKMFDVALDLLHRCPHLAVALDADGNSPVFILSGMPSAFHSGSRLGFWQRWIYSCIRVQPTPPSNYIRIDVGKIDQGQTDRGSIVTRVFGQLHGLLSYLLKLLGIMEIYDTKFMHVQALQILDLIFERMPDLNDFDERVVQKALFHAIKVGIVEFIMKINKVKSGYFMWIKDTNSRGIFQCAVVFRQEKIWSLVYESDEQRDFQVSRRDQFDNNMLHLAGMLAPPTRLDHISGAALQMQRELQWFKEVESSVSPICKEMPNSDDKTPRELFTEEHRELVKEGQKWMKDTATSCAFVAALIVTIMFTAAFTVPGGNNQDSGFPIFSKKMLFKAFIVCDAISFLSATTSIVIFLGILTSRYAEEDFLKSLPTKMILGLATLLISIATMIIAFCAAVSLMLHGQMLGIFILVLVLASVPIIIFVRLQFPLFIEIFISTYGPNIFKRKQSTDFK